MNKKIYFSIFIILISLLIMFSLSSCGAVENVTPTLNNIDIRQLIDSIDSLYKQNAEDKRLLMEKMDRMNDKIIENETHSKDSFESTKKLGEELAKIQTMTKTMQNETTNLPSINKNINDIAMMYNNSKLRGNIGEVQLESLLRDGFSYGNILKTQHPVIRNGVNLGIVDFYLELVPNDDSKNIYIDSKFNKDNWLKAHEGNEVFKKEFKKDIKKMIDDLSKYEHEVILFVPSNVIFDDLNEWFTDLNAYASKKEIILASPNTIFYILKLLNDNIKSKNLEKNASNYINLLKDFYKSFEAWSVRFNSYVKGWNTETKKLKDLSNSTTKVLTSFQDIDSNIAKNNDLKELKKEISSEKNNLETLEEK